MQSIQLTTCNSRARIASAGRARPADAVARGVSQITPIFVETREGAVIEDVDGNRFLDLAGGIGCLNVGQRDPAVVTRCTRRWIVFCIPASW